jgi:hypothetical protein
MPKLAYLTLSSSLMVAAAGFMGCDSSSSDSPEAQKEIQARNNQIKDEEDRANKALQKTSGKNAPFVKSIKGAINQTKPGSQ